MNAFGGEFLEGPASGFACGRHVPLADVTIVGWNAPGDPRVQVLYPDGTRGPIMAWST